MTLNLQKNADSIQEAFDKVANSKTGDEWVIFEYEGVSNVVKVGDEGDGGIDEFSASFNSGKLQYGAISVRLSPNVLPKIVLVHWQGETVPVSRKATTTSHAQDVRRFLKTVHTILYARNEIDIEPDCIRKEVSKLPGTMAVEQMDSSFSAPTTVGSVYKPVKPHIDINLKERERFWEQMKEDEKQDKVVGEKLLVQEESYKPKNGTAKAPEAYSSTSQPAVSTVAPPMVEKSKSEEVVQSVERMSLNEPVAPPPPPPPMGTQKPTGLCAVALWDYQAGLLCYLKFGRKTWVSQKGYFKDPFPLLRKSDARGAFTCVAWPFLYNLGCGGWILSSSTMADKSCYMGAGGYGSGYIGTNASSSGYAREDYAYGGSSSSGGSSGGNIGASTGGSSNPPGVFKPRTDQSCYMGPN